MTSMNSRFAALAIPVDEPRKMYLKRPGSDEIICDAEGNQAFIELYNIESDIARKRQAALRRQRAGQMHRRGDEPDERQMISDLNDLFADLTKAWRLVGLDGQPIDVTCTWETARELYDTRELFWIRRQVDDFAGNHANWAPTGGIE